MSILDDTRDDWNARPPTRTRTVVPWADRIGVSWHWIGPGSGPSATGSHQKCLDQVRDWQAQHQANGWKDIGYNALICQHARAIEGRGLTYSGSHSPGVNVEHVGLQFMVGDRSGFPSDAMIARAVRLRADIGQLGKNIRRDWPHRQDPEASTSCPGDAIADWVHAGGPTKPTAGGFLMALSDEQQTALYNRIMAGAGRLDNDGNPTRILDTRDGQTIVSYVKAATVDPAALASAVAAAMPAGSTITDAQLEAALRKVLGSVDEVTP